MKLFAVQLFILCTTVMLGVTNSIADGLTGATECVTDALTGLTGDLDGPTGAAVGLDGTTGCLTAGGSLDLDGDIDSNIIYSTRSYLPRTVKLNSTAELFGTTFGQLIEKQPKPVSVL